MAAMASARDKICMHVVVMLLSFLSVADCTQILPVCLALLTSCSVGACLSCCRGFVRPMMLPNCSAPYHTALRPRPRSGFSSDPSALALAVCLCLLALQCDLMWGCPGVWVLPSLQGWSAPAIARSLRLL